MKNRHILTFAAALAAAPALAQGLHESIGVDGKYVREVIVQDKVFTLPKRLGFTVESSPLACWEEGVPTPFTPKASQMPVVTPFASRAVRGSRGYLGLGLGSWLDGNLSAGYRFVQSPKTTAGACLQFNTTSLHRPRISVQAADVRRRLADGRLGLYASHIFDGKGTVDAAADYRLAGWNYYGYAAMSGLWADGLRSAGEDAFKAPTQTLHEANARIGWRGERDFRGFSYDAALGVRHFGYRALYLQDAGASGLSRFKGDRETALYLDAGLRKRWRGGSELGLGLRGDMLLYADRPDTDSGSRGHDDYGMLTLTPYYRFSRGLLNMRLGVDVDLAFAAGRSGDRYSVFHMAPDVRLDWRKGGVGLFLNVLGGSELQTLASQHALDYYAMPLLADTRPVYSPLDASAGANFGPFAGFSAGVAFRYRISRRMPTGGWYMAMLNYGSLAMPGMSLPDGCDPADVRYGSSPEGIDMHGLSLAVHAGYRLGSILELEAEGTYQPQDGEKGYFNGYDRPRWTASVAATVKPVEKLSLSLEYEYRGVRRIYTQAGRVGSAAVPGGIPVIKDPGDGPMPSLRLPDLTLLGFRAGWQFTPKVGVFVQGANLLDRRDDVLPFAPMQGISVVGGVNLLF